MHSVELWTGVKRETPGWEVTSSTELLVPSLLAGGWSGPENASGRPSLNRQRGSGIDKISFYTLSICNVTSPARKNPKNQTIAYDGTDFAGFQFQAGGARTVQSVLERAAARALRPAGRAAAAGRTDGGAHAAGQVAHLDARGRAPRAPAEAAALLLRLNAVLPPDLKVVALEAAPPGFDAHASSVGKEYHYLLDASPAPAPSEARARWWVHDRYCRAARGAPAAPGELLLDVGAMREAAALLTVRAARVDLCVCVCVLQWGVGGRQHSRCPVTAPARRQLACCRQPIGLILFLPHSP